MLTRFFFKIYQLILAQIDKKWKIVSNIKTSRHYLKIP